MQVSIRNLYAGYSLSKKEKNIVIEDLTTTFESSKWHFITGISGCGKSTFIETLSFLIPKISGDILFDDVLIENNKKSLKYFRDNSAIMLQYTDRQFFNNTVEEEIVFNLKRNNEDKTVIKKKLFEVLELLNIDKKLLLKSPFEISGGEKRMIALASVIISSPKILFLDEPTVGLDFESKNRFMNVLYSLNKDYHTTIIQSSHILEDIVEYGDSVFILNNNKEFIKGCPHELLFSSSILDKFNLQRTDIHYYIEELENLGVININSNIKTKKDLVSKLFYNKEC